MRTSPRLAAVVTLASIAAATGCTGGHASNRTPVTSSSSASAAPTSSIALTRRDVLRRYVETDAAWIRAALAGGSYGGRFFCGLNILGTTGKPARVYIWAECEEFYKNNRTATLGSGSSLPAVLRITGSGAGTKVIGFAVPRDGSRYGPDVRRLFPPHLATTIFAGRHAVDQTEAQLRARAEAALRAGVLPSGTTG